MRHILRPVIFTSSLPFGNGTTVENTTGEKIKIARDSGNSPVSARMNNPNDLSIDKVTVDDVSILFADVTAKNGVLHVLDHVL